MDTTAGGWSEEVLRFWFDELGESRWFARDEGLDAAIRNRFLAVYERVRAMGPGDFATPRQALAAVIVLDQFPRNMFRGTSRAFAADALARDIARGAIDAAFDGALTPAQRLFLYLPFEHSESLDDQAKCVELMRSLEAFEETRGALHWAILHRDIIARFGRFPHRNAVLGRPSTAEELDFLKQPGSGF